MTLREWLIAIGALIIIVIILDGLRRMRRARKDAIAISSGMGADDIDDSPLDDSFNPELPNGGARPASRNSLEERGYVTSASVSEASEAEQPAASAEPDVPSFSADDPDPEPPGPDELSSREPVSAVDTPPETDSEEEIVGEARTVRRPKRPERKKMMGRKDPEPPTVTEVEEDTASRGEPSDGPREGQPMAGANRPPAEEVIVINVLASEERGAFSGTVLQKLFEACGLELGDLDIYHRHETGETTSPVQFSVANAVEPGTFTPREMEQMSTPGISFFMSLPGPTNNMQAFDFMLETAQAVVRNLGGELKDERRSVMTAQTIEHCRQRIREYERKRRFKR
ncbi:cell division protein ZipA [Marinobacter lacisalsi]|uniref:Cell division protein ZipA n=1 Tax=Marinobacter lacisalsi TaxID=475979 RepID=A0ABV8QGN7_9GAMM